MSPALSAEGRDGRMKTHRLLQLGHKQLPVVVKQPVQRLQHVAGRKVELVQHNPVPQAHSRHECAFNEGNAAAGRSHVRADVLSDVRVLVVV